MIARQRLDRIVETVSRNGAATVPELAESFGISESTIRRDLDKLDSAGRLVKVHGGAVCLEDEHVRRELTIGERADLRTAEKARIARYAASLIGPDDLVYIDAGTTCRALVDHIGETRASYVTNSLDSAAALAVRGLSVVVLGGEVKPATAALVGPEAVETLSRYRFTLGFWGANGVSREYGLTTAERLEAQVKRLSIARTGRPFLLADHTKLGRVGPVVFDSLEAVTVLTDEVPPDWADVATVRAV
ncbi:DeoR/GlpR transcriptional regulator [Coriobacteriaceae bacterium]|nr:DeoR/GlpR transcriptional regulator [Atopobiaceae bacterium FL090493]TGY59016.1 DeoR/GlpR transcriptional regulator [Coriobacteriaceae bacterium]